MKVAIPIEKGRLCKHFGHCEKFAVVYADPGAKKILSISNVDAPPHEPGLLPRWLDEMGVNCVIAGGIGERAERLFNERGITVITGASAETPETLVTEYLEDRLTTGANVCDH